MSTAERLEAHPRHGYLGLLGLIAGLASGGAALYRVAGPPYLPGELPAWDAVLATLRGSYLPPEALAYLLTAAAWAMWLWIAVTVALRLLVLCAEVLTHGATWVRSLRRFSDLVTPAVVRRLVDGAMIAIVVANLVGQSPSLAEASAAALLPPVPALTVGLEPATLIPSPEQAVTAARCEEEYTVRPGDTLWSIAEQFYGTGHEYPRIVAANIARQMPDGRRFTQAGVIHPGWVLKVPVPSRGVETADGTVYYVVEKGDTLRGIAARLLGDEARWPVVFEANSGVAKIDDRHVLTDPGLIWPGLRLKLPAAAPERAGATPQPVVPAEGTDAPLRLGIGSEAKPAPPVSVEPTPYSPAVLAEPPVILEPEPRENPAPVSGGVGTQTLIYGAAGLAAVAGGAVLLSRRRVRRSLDEPPVRFEEDRTLASASFAEGEFTRAFTHRLYGDEAEPLAIVVGQFMRFLEECGLAGVSIVTARQGRNSLELTLDADPEGQSAMLESALAFASRLGGRGRAEVSADRDVLMRLSGLKLASLLAPAAVRTADRLCLLPLGVLPGRETLYANWPELGHVLIAGVAGAGTEVLLPSLLAALTARRHPEELTLYAIASTRALPAEMSDLPHLQLLADPTDAPGTSAVLEQVRGVLIERMRGSEPPEDHLQIPGRRQPDVVLVVGEATELADDTTLEMIALHGTEYGVRILAATTDLAAMDDSAISHFQTRMVLQTTDDEESIRLLGRPDAADLDRGAYLLRIDGRIPVRVRGFRVSPEHLAELVRLMRASYGDRPGESDSGSAIAGTVDLDGSVPSQAHGRSGEDASSEAPAEVGVAHSDTGSTEGPTEPSAVFPVPSSGDLPASEIRESSASEPTTSSDSPEDEAPEQANGHMAQTAATTEGNAGAPAGWEDLAGAALVQISCFGRFAVMSGERVITPNGQEGTSFKAWEVLAYLACQPDGVVSKEKLLETLWPEVDEDRASNRMRVAMARLRSLLARQVPDFSSEAVRCERDGTCRLDIAVILSDVHRFTSLCRSASRLPIEEAKAVLQQARALYDGDLLQGTSYVWADERGESGLSLRESYREEYYRATQRLARLHCQQGEPANAVPLYRSLLKAEPTLEDVVREIYRCYGQLGDLSSLIREDRHLRQALREVYFDPDDPVDDPNCYQPEPETVDLFNTVRAELQARSAPRVNIPSDTAER